jgi:hypothetical protein
MTHILVRADGSYDRGAIFAKARKELRRGLHDDWSAALFYAWRVAKGQREAFDARAVKRPVRSRRNYSEAMPSGFSTRNEAMFHVQ